jgi:hypothetical protein
MAAIAHALSRAFQSPGESDTLKQIALCGAGLWWLWFAQPMAWTLARTSSEAVSTDRRNTGVALGVSNSKVLRGRSVRQHPLPPISTNTRAASDQCE